MQLNEYQDLAVKTDGSTGTDIRVTALGLTGESGEFADLVKKIYYHGHPQDENQTKLISELGDILWYLATGARNLGLTLEEIARFNIAKLQARYPEGFSTERSINRPS